MMDGNIEDYEYYLKEQAFLSAEKEYEENELLREMYQKPAEIRLLNEIPDIQHDRVKIQRTEIAGNS